MLCVQVKRLLLLPNPIANIIKAGSSSSRGAQQQQQQQYAGAAAPLKASPSAAVGTAASYSPATPDKQAVQPAPLHWWVFESGVTEPGVLVAIGN
jgi:hypothetical protein